MNISKKLLSLVLALAMTVGTFSSTMAFAAEADTPGSKTTTTTTDSGTPTENLPKKVTTLKELTAALADKNVTEITITKSIFNIDHTIVIDHPVVIKGESPKRSPVTLSFSNKLNGLENGKRNGILIQTTQNVTIDSLDIKINKNSRDWQGVYGIQVYASTDVTLNNISSGNADGGILVNGSKVKLEGYTGISGNQFGGIEVSKGADPKLSDSILTVNSTLANGDEIYGTPTIWVVKDNDGKPQGSIEGKNASALTENDKVKNDQIQYYTEPLNAIEPTPVNSIEDLKTSLNSSEIQSITITADIKNIDNTLQVNRPVMINGLFHTLAFTDKLNSLGDGQRNGILILSDDVKIRNLTVKMTPPTGEWKGTYGIQAYKSTGVVLHNVTTSGADGGILVNGSEVELTSLIDVSGNRFGGIEVSTGKGLTQTSTLTVNGPLINEDETYEKPTIWVVKDNNQENTVQGDHAPISTRNIGPTETTPMKIYYYQYDNNSIPPENGTANVSTATQFLSALNTPDINKINVYDNIHFDKGYLKIDRPLIINGDNHYLDFSEKLNSGANGERQGILILSTKNVTINSLNLNMHGDLGWQGVYGIQAYNSTGVTLTDITSTGADGGILVNGSEVTLTGTTDVSDNEFGGIEVSKGTADGLKNSTLTVNGTLVNDNEDYRNPTIWLVKEQGTVTGTSIPKFTNKTLKFDQIQYFLNAENASSSTVEQATSKIDSVKNLTPDNIADEDKGKIKEAAAAILGLSDTNKQMLNKADIKKVSDLLEKIAPPASIPRPTVDTSSSIPDNDRLTVAPTVSGLLLAAGITGAEPAAPVVTLTTTQLPKGSDILKFSLDLTKNDTAIHDLAFPVSVTFTFPSSFNYNPSQNTYTINHLKNNGSSESLPVSITGTSGNYQGTFTTSSFSTFTVVGTQPSNPGGNSGSNHSSSGNVVPTSTATYVSDTKVDFTVNGAYQFKITSTNGQAPNFVVGTAGVFNSQLVKTEGQDYFFKITAIGNPGAKAGLYVNGEKLLVATVGSTFDNVKSDTTSSFNVKIGGNYTFKLTADKKPTLTAGTSSAFKVEFVKVVGTDYFYKVTAIGKSGAACGFYINAQKTPVAVATIKD